MSSAAHPLLGIVGGGQLGRMMAEAAKRLGIRARFLDPSPDACAADVGELIHGPLEDEATLRRFADGLSAATYEYEHFPPSLLDRLESMVGSGRVWPRRTSLEAAQHRDRQKRLFDRCAIPTARWVAIDGAGEVPGTVTPAFGFPAMLKRTYGGYDGRGQQIVRSAAEIIQARARLGGGTMILEELVPFSRELSIVGARDRTGDVRFYPIVENEHREGILFRTIVPAPNLSRALEIDAQAKARRLAEALDHVGVFTIELFEVNGALLANEFASRVHNTGHWTIEGAATSQFENHVRAVMGMPLGDTRQVTNAVMINLIGNLPDAARVQTIPGAHLHVYGKAPKPRRKVGHVTITDDDATLADSVARLMAVLRDGGVELVEERDLGAAHHAVKTASP